jgi:hypothetical protein
MLRSLCCVRDICEKMGIFVEVSGVMWVVFVIVNGFEIFFYFGYYLFDWFWRFFCLLLLDLCGIGFCFVCSIIVIVCLRWHVVIG